MKFKEQLTKHADEIISKMKTAEEMGMLGKDAKKAMWDWVEKADDHRSIIKFLDSLINEDIKEEYEEEHGTETDIDKGYSGGADYGEEDKALDDEDRAEMAEPLAYPSLEEHEDPDDRAERKRDAKWDKKWAKIMRGDALGLGPERHDPNYNVDELKALKKEHFNKPVKEIRKGYHKMPDGTIMKDSDHPKKEVKPSKFNLREYLRKNPINPLREEDSRKGLIDQPYKSDMEMYGHKWDSFDIDTIQIIYTDAGDHYKTKVHLKDNKVVEVPFDIGSEALAEMLEDVNVYADPELFVMDYNPDSSIMDSETGMKDLDLLKRHLKRAKIELDIDPNMDVS